MTYSWRNLSCWSDKQYGLTEEATMLSWQLEVMVGGNRAEIEGASLSFELYCCYRFPIRKKDSPLYWPATSMKVCLNHTGQQRPFFPSAVHNKWGTVQWSHPASVSTWLVLSLPCLLCEHTHINMFVSFTVNRIVCEMAAAPKGSAPGPVKLCVGECRPELSVQSSQLYSFVVKLMLKNFKFVSVCLNKHQPFSINQAELNKDAVDWT